jgi:DNA-binding response OmpR family regulator
MEKSVMIVDDDSHIRLAVKELFESEGVGVVTADGAEQCLRELEKGFRGVILMDIMMPEKDGWDAIRDMVDRGLVRGNVISMLTAREVPDEKMSGLQEYVIDYITKPFDPKEVVATVKEYFTYLGK